MGKKDWRACDIAIYEADDLKDADESRYASIPPKVVIEVDTKADLSNFNSDLDYYIQKTNKLFAFGVEKIIWIYTREPRKIMIAAPNADWRITDWTSEIELLPGTSFRLSDLMKK